MSLQKCKKLIFNLKIFKEYFFDSLGICIKKVGDILFKIYRITV